MSILKKLISRLIKPHYGWFGDYKSWEEAKKQSRGYEESHILEKVKEALLKVKNGEAAAERDSVIFDKVQYSWPLLANILHIAGLNKGVVNVIDFGGSLGSTYYQNKKYLDELESVSWNIVEQENFVTAGQESFADKRLAFFRTVEECISEKGKAHILLLSCVLPYLPQPYQMLDKLMDCGAEYIIIENTPLQDISKRDILCVQKVHPSIYSASYPCWLLNRQKLFDHLLKKYSLFESYENESIISWGSNKIQYNGAVFKKG